jgi:hypothetical protein
MGNKMNEKPIGRSKAKAFMVAAGLCLSLLDVNPAFADFRDDFPQILTMSPLGVNLQTGRFHYMSPDLSIGSFNVQSRWNNGGGVDTSWAMTPTSFLGIGLSLRGWMYWTTKNTFGGGQMTMVKFLIGEKSLGFAVTGTPPNHVFMPWDSGTEGWKLVKSGTSYILTNASGDTYTFIDHPAFPTTGYLDKEKLLGTMVTADGGRLDYTYGSSGQILNVQSNRGYAIVYQYDSAASKVHLCGFNTTQTYVNASTTCSGSALKVTYNFVSNGTSYELQSIVDVRGGTSSLTRTGGLVSCITLVNSSTCKLQNSYGPQPGGSILLKPDQVAVQTTATGQTYTYDYDMSAYGADNPPQQPGQIIYSSATMTDPNGVNTEIIYANGIVDNILVPGGRTYYKYNGLQPEEITFPEGNKLSMPRDINGNALSRREIAKPGSGLIDKVATQSFPQPNSYSNPTICSVANVLCRKPINQVDERGNQTDFTYDATHGGVLTETGPAVNGVRPQVRYSYAQRYAWIKNSGGAYVQSATPIWVMTQKSICKTGAASGAGCAVAGDEVITTYDYGPNSGPNNLLLRGVVEDANGLALRTCYGYDSMGNKISETKPRAGLGGCP